MANPVADVALEDLTARAWIRDAALVLFAERGTKVRNGAGHSQGRRRVRRPAPAPLSAEGRPA